MKTKMSATSSGEGASSQTSAVTTSTVQSSVWSLCDISTDSHVDLRDITPSISPVFTDDQVHALTRNPNEVDVLDEHFIPHDALKRIDEALRSQGGRNLLYSITNSAPTVAPYNDNETTDLHFTEAMFSQFDTISDETDKIINKDDRSLQNITVSGRDIMQSSQSNALNWKRDAQSTETSGAQNSHESKPGNPGESNMPKGLRRSPRNLAQLKKDAESSKTTVATTRPISRGKDISKLKYANAKKEDLTKKEVRRSGRVPKKMEKDDSSEDKSASEVKTSAKKKNTREAGEEKKSSSEEQDVAAKNVRRSPRNMNKLQEEEKNIKPSRKKQEKLVEVEKDNKRQNTSLVIDKEADCEETCDTEKKPASKSEIQFKTEKDSKENNNLRAEKEQEEKQERKKSGRATRKPGSKEKTSEDEDVSKDVKTRKKKEDNLATKKTEKTCKAEKVDEEDLVKNKKESSIDINAKSTSKDDVPSDKPKKNELQNRQQGRNSSEDDGRIKARKKDQTKTKETEDGGKEEENQGSDEGGNKKEQDHPQKNSSKTTEMVAKCTSVEKKEGNTGGNRCKGSEDAKQESKADKKEVKSAVLNETDVKSSGVEKVVDATLVERPGNDSAEQKEVTTDVNREGEKEASDMEDSSDNEEELNEDSDYDPEYDPDRLWCVCRKPHGNRFMICCDQCEEWFHGACVGVTMSQGRQMEKKGQEYICPKCKVKLEEESKKEPVPAKPEETPPSTPEKAKKHRASKADHSPKLKMPDNKDEPRRHRHSSHRESSEGSLQHERKSKHSEKIFIKVQPKEERKRKIHEPTSFKIPKKVRTTPTPASHFRHPEKRKCITSGCSMFAHRGSLYCSQECIARHVEESVRILSDERRKRLGAKATGTSSKSVLSPTSSLLGPAPWDPNPAPVSSEPPLKQGIAVIERSTGRVIAGVAAPSQEELVYWLQDHPMFEVLRPSGTVGKDDKNEKKKEGSEKTVRENIKKSLKEILITRCKEQQDLSVSEEDFQKCANSVEQEMYSFFGDTGPRYKNKYRSLMFNLKDPRNKVLFRHVLSGEISVDRLVRMTPEQLASPELATWREQEVKHTLEMIKLNQEEINATKAHIKKTHKGEVEIDDDDLSNLENSVKIKAEQNAEKDLPDSNTSSATLLLDTTDEHRIHLFDLNCRICTGKMAPPGEPPRRETPAPLVSTTAIIQAVAESSMPSPTPVDVTSANSPDSASVSQPPLSPSALSKATKKVPAVWKGFVMMQSVAKFGTNAYQVSGPCDDLLHLLPDTLHIQGRIAHEQVWDYLVQLKSSTSREVCVIRYEASSSEEKMSYLSLYSYFYSRNRCGVVSNCYTGVKDMYLVPLASHQPVPPELMPFDGPGLDEPRPHMLLGVIVRAKALFKRPRALSQRSLSPPAKRRASSGSLETSSSEGVAVESPVKKRDVQVALHDSPPADIDDIVFQYHSSQAVKNASKEKTESPAKASTPTDFSTLPVSSSSGPVVSPVVSAPLLSLEAQKQHLLDLQERARQYILAQTQRKVTDSGATNSEVAGQQTTETTGASKGEQHMPISDDSAPYDPEEGLDLDLDDPSSKPAEVVPESGPKIPAVIASSQEPTKPSGIQMLVSTLKKLQGSAAKSLAPQLSALTSVLSSQRSSGTAANQQDQSSTSTVSSTPPLQLTTAASQETRLPVFGHPRSSVQSVSSAADVLKSAVSPGSGQPEMVSTSRHVHSPNSTGPGSGSSVSSSEAWRTSAATGCGPYARPAQSASSIILGQQTSVSSGHELQSALPTRSVVQSTAPVRLGPPSTVCTSREPQSSRPPASGPPLTTPVDPQSKVVPGLAAHSSASTGRGALSVALAGIAVPRVSTSDGSSTGIHEMQSTSVSTGSGTHLTVSSRPSFQSAATTNQGQQSAIPSGRVLQPDAGNRWSPSEPPQIVRRVEHGTQQERDCNGLRPEERARLAAHESRRFRGHNRDERSNQGRMGDTHRPDWGEQRFPRDSRSHEPGQGWRGQYRPGRPWSGGERRRDRHERSFDHRSRPGEQRDERRFKEHWNRDRWRR